MAEILGHIIAHEVGHLLGVEAHCMTRIMRGDWNSQNLRDAACGRFLFTPQQAEIVRSETRRRVGLQESFSETIPRRASRSNKMPSKRLIAKKATGEQDCATVMVDKHPP
jgi:hypothetical protein